MWVDTYCTDKRSSAELSEALIQCISDMETPKYAMRTSTTLKAPPFPQRKTMEIVRALLKSYRGLPIGRRREWKTERIR